MEWRVFGLVPRFGLLLLLFERIIMVISQSDIRVELDMPRWAPRGSSAQLKCSHDVPSHLLYKVEFLRFGTKIFQYIRERRPPFRNFTTPGAALNMSLATESTITLQRLDFTASGVYSCEVSMETPIYTKASNDHELTIIQPQKHLPKITFGASLYTVGELLQANCTSAAAHPAPHITWLINGKKVDESLTRPFVTTRHMPNSVPLATSTTQLSVAVSELHVTEGGKLELTCLSTIPSYIGPKEKYADIKKHAVTVEVILTDAPEPTPTEGSLLASGVSIIQPYVYSLLLIILIHLINNVCAANLINFRNI